MRNEEGNQSVSQAVIQLASNASKRGSFSPHNEISMDKSHFDRTARQASTAERMSSEKSYIVVVKYPFRLPEAFGVSYFIAIIVTCIC